MLHTTGLSKELWGEAIFTACHVLNRVHTKNKDNTIRGIGEEKANTFIVTYMGVFGNGQCANNQEM
jgi:hypothetical protein